MIRIEHQSPETTGAKGFDREEGEGGLGYGTVPSCVVEGAGDYDYIALLLEEGCVGVDLGQALTMMLLVVVILVWHVVSRYGMMCMCMWCM